MYRERRRMVRRSLSGGVVLAVLGAVPLALIEVLYVLLVRQASLATTGEAVAFAAYAVLVLLAAAGLLGAAEGIIFLGVSLLTKRLSKQRLHEPRWMAIICSFLALPAIAMVASKVFAGRRAQLIPGKDVLAVLLGLAGLAAAYGVFRLVILVRDRFRIRRWGPRQGWFFFPGLLAAALAVYAVDQLVLARLYLWFHVSLTMLTVALCQLAVATIYMANRPRQHWMGRLAEPGVALLVLVGAVAGGALALNRLGGSETLRFVAHEHTVVQARVLMITGSLGVSPPQPVARKPVSPPEAVKPAAAPLVAGPRTPDANVLLITVDALRADHMGTYGYSRKTTPNLGRWARGAAVFERAYCQVPHTSFSLTSLMTGAYMYSLSKRGRGGRVRTLPEALRRYGYKTAGFFPPAVFYIDREQFSAFEKSRFGFEYVKYEFLDAGRRVDQVIAFLRQHEKEKKKKFFIWVHFFEAHEPYVKHKGFDFGPGAVDRYDSEIAYVDHHLGRLLAHVGKAHPRTVIALTADHGEEFGEHGGHYHGNALYEQQVRVPLIISVPGLGGRRINGWSQVIDLPMTFLSMLDVPAPAEMRGTDLGPWIAGAPPARLPPAFCEMDHKKMVVHGHRKLLCDLSKNFCEMYDLVADPGERRNLVSRRPAERDRLQGLLRSWLASHTRRRATEDKEQTAEQLLARGKQRDPGAVPGLIRLCRRTGEVRRQAVEMLTYMRPPAARATLEALSKDSDPGVALPARVGAALLGHESSLDKLAPLLRRPDLPPHLRRSALLALAKAGKKAAALPLGEILSSGALTVYHRIEVINALGALGDVTAAPALMKQLSPLRTRLWAIKALGRVKATAAVTRLARGLRQDRFISWRKASALALGRIGDTRAVPVLRRAVLLELEADVTAAALSSLSTLKGLPVQGTTPLQTPPWSCKAGACTVDLGVTCSELADRDLLLLLEADAATVGGDRVKAPAKAPPAITVHCGQREHATLEPSRGPAFVVPVASGLDGALTLRAAGKAPPVSLAASRRTPKESTIKEPVSK